MVMSVGRKVMYPSVEGMGMGTIYFQQTFNELTFDRMTWCRLLVYSHYGKFHTKLVGFEEQNVFFLFSKTH